MTLNTILLILALVVVIAMASYAVHLLLALKKQKAVFRQARRNRVQRIKDSIEIIAKAMQNGDCNLSEGAIRLKMLLDPIGLSIKNYAALNQLFLVVEEMPTHEARRELKNKERMRLDLTRESAEADLEQKIQSELTQLLQDIQPIVE